MGKSVLILILGLALITRVQAQHAFDQSKLLRSNGISVCEIYQISEPRTDTIYQTKYSLRGILRYDTIGRLIEKKWVGYNFAKNQMVANSIEHIEYQRNKTIKTEIDSIHNITETKIHSFDSSKNLSIVTHLENDTFKSRFLTYYNKEGIKVREETYKSDSILSTSHLYKYLVDSIKNLKEVYLNDKISEVIQTVYDSSYITTTFNSNGSIQSIVYENKAKDGRTCDFCQVIYDESIFDFFCTEYHYNNLGQLTRIDYPIEGNHELLLYNRIGLLYLEKFYNRHGLRSITKYTYE